MQQYKNDYIAKKLSLTEEQKAKFMPLYNAMDEEIRKAQGEASKLYRQTQKKAKKGDVTNLEYEKAAEALYELKGRENEIEMKYFTDFKKILTPAQLFKLRDAERDFTRQLMKQHGEKRAKR
ncbi:MAG: Spy/CpxP family protein refolding chaperone [Staphylococcus sp.]|nr:Spy/CpxP family protein refolding chaperone [Staphylococcus sp.]